ncbi:MAG: hypothetical protein Q8S33_17255 [Myxococcales bacterium]|nr:hypothetical protein [Myxococcales bacterium]
MAPISKLPVLRRVPTPRRESAVCHPAQPQPPTTPPADRFATRSLPRLDVSVGAGVQGKAQVRSQKLGAGAADTAGSKSLEAFLSAHAGARPQVRVGLKELLASGSLSHDTAKQLAASGTTVAELRQAAVETRPHQCELGALGEAMGRAVVDLLFAATDLSQLTEGPLTRAVSATSLPTYVGQALAAGQPPSVQQALGQFLTAGFISPKTFEGLGAQGLGRLALSLAGGTGALETLLGAAGGKRLGEAAVALGQAALAQVGSFEALTKVFLTHVPNGEKKFWKERTTEARVGGGKYGDPLPGEGALDQRPIDSGKGGAGGKGTIASGQVGVSKSAKGAVEGEAHTKLGNLGSAQANGQANAEGEVFAGADGRVTVGADGVNASGRAGVGARGRAEASGEASVETGLSSHRVSGHAEAEAEVFAGAEGHAHVGADGVKVKGRVGASAEAEVSATADMNHEFFGGVVGADTHIEGSARARAAAQVTVEGNIGFDEEGDVEAFVGVSAEAVALVEAEAKASQSINIFGFKFVVGGYARASAGVGAEANGGAGYRDGKFYVLGGAGAAGELGGSVGGFTSIEVPRWAQQVLNMVAKTEQGRDVIGSVGSALGGLLSGGNALRA